MTAARLALHASLHTARCVLMSISYHSERRAAKPKGQAQAVNSSQYTRSHDTVYMRGRTPLRNLHAGSPGCAPRRRRALQHAESLRVCCLSAVRCALPSSARRRSRCSAPIPRHRGAPLRLRISVLPTPFPLLSPPRASPRLRWPLQPLPRRRAHAMPRSPPLKPPAPARALAAPPRCQMAARASAPEARRGRRRW